MGRWRRDSGRDSHGRGAMQTPDEYRKYAEECERIARNGPQEHQETLLKIARAWRECAENAEKRSKEMPSSLV
jgi:hypothetical protein